jgi:hypothetical protein
MIGNTRVARLARWRCARVTNGGRRSAVRHRAEHERINGQDESDARGDAYLNREDDTCVSL